MQFLNRFRKGQEPTATAAPQNLSDALALNKSGGPKPPTEKVPTDAEWMDIWQRLQPYTKDLADKCAALYTAYVVSTGNTTCDAREISPQMCIYLWEAYRRARISELYPHAKTVPNLAPYFVDTVRLLNSRESNSANHVAYICETNSGTNESAWYIAPINEARRMPKIATGKKDEITKILQ